MNVANFLKERGNTSATVHPAETIRSVAERFRQNNVGAVIVSDGAAGIDGILTERGLAYGLVAHGDTLLDMPASALAITATVSCSPEDSMTDVAKVMTERRLGHIPVMHRGRLIAVIDIVDLLEERLFDRRRATRAIVASMMPH